MVQAGEVTVAPVEPIAAALMRVRAVAAQIEPLGGEPLAQRRNLALKRGFGGHLGRASGRLQQGIAFHLRNDAPAGERRMFAFAQTGHRERLSL